MTLDETFLMVGVRPPDLSEESVRVAAFELRSVVDGPGCRAVIWVAGCLRRCPGCMNPEFRAFDVGEPAPVDELYERIRQIAGLDGVTYSGGEPFEQAMALGRLSRRLKRDGLTIAAYSGYSLVALRSRPRRFGPLLDELDLLIDGEYRQELPGPLQWRGSANQALHFLTDRLAGGQTLSNYEIKREVQVSISGETFRLKGFPSPEIEEQLTRHLRSHGVILKKDAS